MICRNLKRRDSQFYWETIKHKNKIIVFELLRVGIVCEYDTCPNRLLHQLEDLSTHRIGYYISSKIYLYTPNDKNHKFHCHKKIIVFVYLLIFFLVNFEIIQDFPYYSLDEKGVSKSTHLVHIVYYFLNKMYINNLGIRYKLTKSNKRSLRKKFGIKISCLNNSKL